MPQAQATSAANLFTTSRVLAYSTCSTLAAATVVYNAFRDRPNFYSAMVTLGRSNGNVGILLNFGFLAAFLTGRFLQLIFFGNLRRVEVDHLWERTWYSVTDSLFAMTIFRDQFNVSFVILFAALHFVKVFHWLGGDRVELMEQTPTLPRFFHFRMVSILSSLFFVDLVAIVFFVEFLIAEQERGGLVIMFASEFVILFCTLTNIFSKYFLNCYDQYTHSDAQWEQKSMWVLTIDLITDFFKLITYSTFFFLIFSYYGLPFNIVKDVCMVARSFYGKIRDLLRYRAATKNMDQRYPNATPEELGRTDGTCIICREDMVIQGATINPASTTSTTQPQPQPQPPPPTATSTSSGLNETPKKLPCGHIFHFYCLRSWLERQQSCPTCRRTVLDANGQPVNQVPRAAPAATQPGVVPAAGVGAAQPTGTTGAGTETAGEAGSAARTPAGSAAQRVGQFARQFENDAQRQRELELEGRTGGNAEASGSAPTIQAPAPTPGGAPASTSTSNHSGAVSVPTGTSSTATQPSLTSSLTSTASRLPSATLTPSGVPRSLISAVFAEPTAAGSSTTLPSSTAATIAGGSRPNGSQWGSAYSNQTSHRRTSAPPGYGYHQAYPLRSNQPRQVQHSLPLPTRGHDGGASSWTPPAPSSLTSPVVQPLPSATSASTSTGLNGATASTTSVANGQTPAPTQAASTATTQAPVNSSVATPAAAEASKEDPLDPREAARAAALKRFAVGNKKGVKSSVKPAASNADQISAFPSSEVLPEKYEAPEASTSSSSAIPNPSTSANTSTPGDPKLIPLFDPSIVPQYQTLHQPLLPYGLVSPSQASPMNSAPASAFDLSSFSSRLNYSSSTANNGTGSSSGLPTRESLEESLRALVAVQENVWKAIEEVTRVVSSLPSSSQASSSSQTQLGPAPPVSGDDVGERSASPASSSSRKGKQAAEGINAPSSASNASSIASASPPPTITESLNSTESPSTKETGSNPWSNFSSSALSSGTSTPANELSQSSLFSSTPNLIPRSTSPSPSREDGPSASASTSASTTTSTSGVVVDELDLTEEQRNQQINNMLLNSKPRRRVSFASRDDHIEPEEKETSEESESGGGGNAEVEVHSMVNGNQDIVSEISDSEPNRLMINGNVNGLESGEGEVESDPQFSDDGTATPANDPAPVLVNGIGSHEQEEDEQAQVQESTTLLTQNGEEGLIQIGDGHGEVDESQEGGTATEGEIEGNGHITLDR